MATKKKTVPVKKKKAVAAKKNRSHRRSDTMPTLYPDISARFKQFKIETGLTFKDIGKTTGIKPQLLQAYATGRICPNFFTLRAFKQKFGLNYDWLIDGVVTSKVAKPLSKKVEQLSAILKDWEAV